MQTLPMPLRLLPLLFLGACSTPPSTKVRNPEDTTRKMTGLEQKFDLFDLNGDGFLTRKELFEGIRSVGAVSATDEDIDKIFAYYDANKDGRISLREAQRGNAAGPDKLLQLLGEN